MPIENALASVAIEAAVPWYEKLLGAAASRPMTEVAEWRCPRGCLQVYRLSERAGSGSFILAVTALEEQIAHLAA